MKTYTLETMTRAERDSLIYRFGKDFLSVMVDTVVPIVNDVRNRGDAAVREYTKKFDGIELDSLKVSDEEIERAYAAISKDQLDAFRQA